MAYIQSKTYFLVYFLAVSQRFISGFNFVLLVSLYDHIVPWMMTILEEKDMQTSVTEFYKNTSTVWVMDFNNFDLFEDILLKIREYPFARSY